MIKYALVCEEGHAFESWFQTGAAFDMQVKRGLVLCPDCQSIKVTKAIMAPALVAARHEDASLHATPPGKDAASADVVLLDETQRKLREMVYALRSKILTETDDVGARFPEEARKMHEGELPHRAIRGEASIEDAKALIADGIGVMPLPQLPDELN
jgi:hypothetical protein